MPPQSGRAYAWVDFSAQSQRERSPRHPQHTHPGTLWSRCRTASGTLLPKGEGPVTTLHPPVVAPQEWPQGVSRSKTVENNRGRYEERVVIVEPAGDWWPKAYLWYGVKSIICVIRTTPRQRQTCEQPVREVHYYLSSPRRTGGCGLCGAGCGLLHCLLASTC